MANSGYYQLEINQGGKFTTRTFRSREVVERALQEAIRAGAAKAAVWMYDDENPRELLMSYGG